ncbi:MAG: T9SS type A sorting domain-containing protein, partial [Candidatus Eisenbacteria sp.]|nr:T9SS type A sorting domain-containing protein [Candidatus Eisenbacteria bacterium]
VTFPDGGEALRQGSIRKLRWATAVPVGHGPALVDIYLSTSGPAGPWAPVALGIPDSGAHEWQVAGEISSSCYLEVQVSAGGDVAVAQSPSPFDILASGTGVVSWAADDGLLRSHPNPATGRTRLTWSRPTRSAGVLSVYDVRGRLVDRQRVERGRDSLDWTPPARLPAGLYLIELRTGLERARGKLLLLGHEAPR